MLKKKFLILILIYCGFFGKAQLDLEHWLAPISWFAKEGAPRELYESKIYLSTPHETPFLVKLFNGDDVIASFMLSKSAPVIYDLSSDVYFTGDKFLFKPVTRGLHIAGANSFYASYRISTNLGEEVITSKGKTAIGKQFFVGGTPSSVENYGVYFTSIYATKNNTKITIKNKQNRIIFADGQKHSKFSFILNKGESYSLKVRATENYITDFGQIPYAFNNDVYNDFLGAEISADLPVAVTNGNDIGQVALDESINLLYDQSIPVKNLGQNYFIRMGFSSARGGSEGALIIATEDNTKVYFNNDSMPITLNKGQHYSTLVNNPDKFIEHDAANVDLNRNYGVYVRSSAKIYCYQFTAGTANVIKLIGYLSVFCQSMSLVLPLDASLPGTIDFIPNFSKIGSKVTLDSRINIYLPKGQTPSVNDVPVSNITGPFNILGTDDYKYFQMKMTKNTIKNLKVSANSGLVINILNGHERIAPRDFEDTRSFTSHYTGFSNDPYIIKKGNCIQEDVLLSLNNIDFEGFQWQLNGTDIPGANSSIFKPLMPGLYTCVLSYSTFTYITKAVSVEDCPYTISTNSLGSICPNFTLNPKFTAPNDNHTFVKLEILTPPNFGNAVIENNKIKIVNNSGFDGSDRFVYKITASNGFYEVVKVEFIVLPAVIGDLKSEIYNIGFVDPKYYFDLNSAINKTNGEIFSFYATLNDAEKQVNEIFNLLAFSTENLEEVFVRTKTSSGCFIINKVLLLKLPPEPPVQIVLSNVLTPNGDGINDIWDYSILKEYQDLRLVIYNRFGKQVFENSSGSEDYFWDGKSVLQRPLPTGTYWVSYSYKGTDGIMNVKNMWILLKVRN